MSLGDTWRLNSLAESVSMNLFSNRSKFPVLHFSIIWRSWFPKVPFQGKAVRLKNIKQKTRPIYSSNELLLWQVILIPRSSATASPGNLHPGPPAGAATVSMATALFPPGQGPPFSSYSTESRWRSGRFSLDIPLRSTWGEALTVSLSPCRLRNGEVVRNNQVLVLCFSLPFPPRAGIAIWVPT